ncbi:polysaccharide deacetylase family protein [Streptomyces tsukubensis]|nr:polysaccharide deacetylase family protein [Streptomyces tsukubensis]QFR92688.1 polysaccharide deacetylase family protein [Streptomyces tsukubensis]
MTESFYHLTKSADLDPHRVRAQLIDPLYATVEKAAAPYFAERGYLTWAQLRELDRDPLVTVANHTFRHENLSALSTDALRQEVHHSHTHFTQRMGGARPRCFTVPFGRLTQELALDLLDPLTSLGYTGILWVGSAGVTVHAPYAHQVLHLMRLHAANSVEGFAAQVRAAGHDATRAAIWQVPATVHHRPARIVPGSGAGRAGRLEMVLRQGKDYASDPRYYRYQFTDNPWRGDRPDYHTVEVEGRPEAIAYCFHSRFTLDGRTVPGIYLSGWRKLPHAHSAAAGQLLRALLAREPIVGVHRPNPDIHAAFRGWCRARVHQLDLPVQQLARPVHQRDLPVPRESRQWDQGRTSVTESAALPPDCEELCAASTSRAGFTVTRDPAYHHWRHTGYPLTPAAFLAVRRAGVPAALAVTLHLGGVTHVVDFHLAADEEAGALVEAVLTHAAGHGSTAIRWETSDSHLRRTAVHHFGATATVYDNFYRFHPALLTSYGITPPGDRWPDLPLHETASTSDVLPR